MTREELLSRMSSAELTEWMALFVIRSKEQEEAHRRASSANRGRHTRR